MPAAEHRLHVGLKNQNVHRRSVALAGGQHTHLLTRRLAVDRAVVDREHLSFRPTPLEFWTTARAKNVRGGGGRENNHCLDVYRWGN